MHYGFIIDNRKCIGCHACTVACKSEHDVPIGVNRTWVKYIEKGEYPNTRRLFSVMRCNHCSDAPCVTICPTGALFTRSDGIVDFDRRRCIGCKACMQACPYDALYIDPETETAAKCNYCAHRIDMNLEPACVNVCPTHAIISGDMDDSRSEISVLLSREQVTARKTEKGTQPNVFYIDGDQVSLEANATEPSDNYFWNSQISGVGHFAKYAESRVLASDQSEMAGRLSGPGPSGPNTGEMTRVLVPAGDDPHIKEKAKDVLKEQATRTYDAPGKGVLWDRKVAGYIWTKAISTGVFLVPFLGQVLDIAPMTSEVKWFSITAGLFFLVMTGILLVLDLDQPKRFAYVLLRPQWQSWLVRGGYSITLYGLFLTLWGLGWVFKWPLIEAVAFWSCSAFAVLTAIYTAFLFAQAKGRDFWQSPTLALHMLVHSALAGGAVIAIYLFFVPGGEIWGAYLRTFLITTIVVGAVILAAELLTPHLSSDVKSALEMIVTGQFALRFWTISIVAGLALPLVMLGFFGPDFLPIIGILILLGIYSTESIWVRAPQLVPLS